MNTHEYTDDQIQTAIDAAFPQAGPSYLANLDTSPDTRSWPEEAPNRLAIARAFLAALPKPEPAQVNAEPMESWANADNAKAFQEFQAEIEAVWEGKPTDGPPWIPHDGGPCPLKTEEVEEWELRFRDGDIRRDPGNPKAWTWRHRKETGDIIAYRVLKWKPGYGPQAAQYHMPKLPNPLVPLWTPKPGDVVRLKSGGPAMTIERFDAQASEAFCVMAYAGGVYRGVFQVTTIELANP